MSGFKPRPDQRLGAPPSVAARLIFALACRRAMTEVHRRAAGHAAAPARRVNDPIMRPMLKAVIFALGIFVAAAAPIARALAQNYPWCAYLGTGDGTATNCGFDTREQCMATISGIGGYCERNNRYVPPPGPHSDGPASTSRPDRR